VTKCIQYARALLAGALTLAVLFVSQAVMADEGGVSI
jgi:hypothetical protein